MPRVPSMTDADTPHVTDTPATTEFAILDAISGMYIRIIRLEREIRRLIDEEPAPITAEGEISVSCGCPPCVNARRADETFLRACRRVAEMEQAEASE